ncbi:Y-family DNA polymerase [Rubrimonas sp.]|uniref:Y-family DNA polymerase n=1 Tax=Rubrimonas sp. TaxID=2036015 RepID=UPI002FDC8A50
MSRRVVSLWFPRLAAERALRRIGGLDAPFAIVAERRGALVLAALSAEAEAAGLARDMALADARALCPALRTRPADPPAEAAFLTALARWALRYTPWVGLDGPDGLALDISGCAHLFGGEAAMLADMRDRLAVAGLTARAACADARGAAWALARFAPRSPDPVSAPVAAPVVVPVVVPPGEARAALAPLPVAALRLAPETVEGLARLGLRRIGDLAAAPRAPLARRFGPATLMRLDQALGAAPEPVGAARPAPVFAVRLSLPEPIGRVDDVAAALDRLLARLTETLAAHGAGARRLALTLRRVDRSDLALEIGLARPSRDAALMAELFARPLAELDAGFGIEALRLEAVTVEPTAPRQHRGPLDAAEQAQAAAGAEPDALALLLSRLGGRLGPDRVRRLLPAESHIPTRAFVAASAAFSDPVARWPADRPLRPIVLFPPEPVAPDPPDAGPGRPLRGFRWRGRAHRVASAAGPERIAPEWWLDDPDWRDGPRDYWRVETEEGSRLWLHHRPASQRLATWFAEGEFA